MTDPKLKERGKYIRTKETIEKMKQTIREKYKNGYINPMKGRKRPDLSEYNRKCKSGELKKNNWLQTKKSIDKRMATAKIRGSYRRCGEENPNWKGGVSFEPYTYEFNNELRLAIKIREDFRCFICRKEEPKTPQGLAIHHIDYDKTNNHLNNLVALCPECHTKTNGNRQHWIEYFSREFNVEKIVVSWEKIYSDCEKLRSVLNGKLIDGIVPIYRGGVIPAVILSNLLNKPIKTEVTSDNDVIIDEIVDFGMTLKSWKRKYPNNSFVCLYLNSKHFKFCKMKPDFYVEEVDKWLCFPWEK